MAKEGKITRKEICSVCHWHGLILKVMDDGFVNWTCPRGKAAHSGLLALKTLSEKAIEKVSILVEGN